VFDLAKIGHEWVFSIGAHQMEAIKNRDECASGDFVFRPKTPPNLGRTSEHEDFTQKKKKKSFQVVSAGAKSDVN